MGLNFSQKRLLSKALHSRKQDAHTKRLRLYAFLTGIMSLLITLMQLIISLKK